MNIFKDKTEMPKEPDVSVSSVKVPGESLSEANRDMKLVGQFNHPNLQVNNIQRPRFGHGY